MEGVLCVPPERGTIIGRALWKHRYVVIGVPQTARQRQQQQQQLTKTNSTSRPPNQPARVSTSHSQSSLPGEAFYISVFKNKGDWEPIQQHAVSSITDCQVQMVAHRKQGPVLPTLIINISPDPVTDKIRKRRSSRTAAFTSAKEILATTLWFRPSEENQQSSKHILHDWCRFIQSHIQQPGSASSVTGPMSPVTPASPTFVNPFSTQRPRDISDVSMHLQQLQQNQGDYIQAHRPGSDNRSMHSTGPNYINSSQNHIYTSRDRPMTYSESPSLRSRRSDLSHASSILPHIATQGFGNSINGSHNYDRPFLQSRPSDLPSPATTIGEFQGELIEGWTSAQGRSSAISSPIRGRGSISSPQTQTPAAATPATPATVNSSSPPVPRETILDRAFQMHFIPGSERLVPGEEKLSSLARFDALMREADSRRRDRQALDQSVMSSSTAPALQQTQDDEPKSGWDDDDDEDEDDEEDSDLEDDNDDDVDSGDDSSTDSRTRRRRTGDTIHMRASGQLDPAIKINLNARRALDFIASRHDDADQDGQADPSSLPSQSSSASSSYSTKRAHMAFPRSQSSRVGGSSGSGGGGVDFDAPTPKNFDSGYCSSHPSSALQGQETQLQLQQELLRPQTSPPRTRPTLAQRSNSQTYPEALNASGQNTTHLGSGSSFSAMTPLDSPRPRPTPRALSSSTSLHRNIATGANATAAVSGETVVSATATATSDKRQSSSSTKHLSFTEFTKRLSSSTSSLLLVQTNTSSNSGTGSVILHETDVSGGNQNPLIHHTATRLVPPPAPPPADRCGWRGSVGVFGTEGGFL